MLPKEFLLLKEKRGGKKIYFFFPLPVLRLFLLGIIMRGLSIPQSSRFEKPTGDVVSVGQHGLSERCPLWLYRHLLRSSG